ncbi:MAG: glycosyltransferase [Eubacteriales bacterium]
MKISLIVPMYNESEIIKTTATVLYEHMKRDFGESEFEIIFSDDGSTDGSADAVRSLSLDCVRIAGYENNRGKGCAVRTGMLEAVGDIVMFTDADLAYGTEVIRRAYDYFIENPGTGMLIGSRNLNADGYEGYTPLRRIMSRIYIKVLCAVGGLRLSDSQCGCKAFTNEAAKKIFSQCTVDGFAFDFEAIIRAQNLGITIAEMPVKIINHRDSKVHIVSDTFKMLRDLRRIRKNIKSETKNTLKV